jgi:hypothetical protein
MKYDQIITESLDKVTLKRVRIKVDPASVSVAEDLAKCDGYEGYVLAEDQSYMKVLVVIPGTSNELSVISVPIEYLELVLQNLDQLRIDNFKRFIITSLDISDDDPVIQQIESSESIEDVEVFLRDRGMTDEEITKLYKYYIV